MNIKLGMNDMNIKLKTDMNIKLKTYEILHQKHTYLKKTHLSLLCYIIILYFCTVLVVQSIRII